MKWCHKATFKAPACWKAPAAGLKDLQEKTWLAFILGPKLQSLDTRSIFFLKTAMGVKLFIFCTRRQSSEMATGASTGQKTVNSTILLQKLVYSRVSGSLSLLTKQPSRGSVVACPFLGM